MNNVPQIFAADEAMLFVASVLMQATLVIMLALILGWVLRHRPLLRHSVLVGGLLCVCFCPAAAYLATQMDANLISVAWPSSLSLRTDRTVAQPSFAPPAPREAASGSTTVDAATGYAEPTPSVAASRPMTTGNARDVDTTSGQPAPIAVLADEAHTWRGSDGPDPELSSETRTSADENSQLLAAAPESSSDNEHIDSSVWSSVVGFAGLIWLTGVVVIGMRLLLACRFLHRLRANAIPLDVKSQPDLRQAAEEALDTVAAKRLPPLLISDDLKGPVSLGFSRPAIILPAELFPALHSTQLRDVLVHELAHIHRHDHLVVLLQRLVGAIFWPFPLVWRLNAKIDEAREDVCDNFVLRHTEASQYSRMLLELTERATPQAIPLAIGLWKCRRKLEHRVGALLDPRRTTGTRLRPLTLCTLAIAFLTVFVLMAGSRIIPTRDVQAAGLANLAAVESPAKVDVKKDTGQDANKDAGEETKQSTAGENTPLSVGESASSEHAAKLANEERSETFKGADGAFKNRPYWWVLPKDLPLKRFIRIAVGDKEELTRLRQKESQTIEIEKAGWLHIALANDGLDGPGKSGRQASDFAKSNGWEKTDLEIGYRVPLHAKATPMYVYRKQVPVGQLTLPRVNWSGPVILLPAIVQVDAARADSDPYDVLYDVIMTRWKDGKAYAHDETSPAVFSWSEFPFDDQTFGKFNAALDAFAALPQDKIEQYSEVQRALMQRNLWELFDTTFNWNWSADWWWDGQRSFPKTHLERRAIVQPKLALLVKRLALTKKQILALPNTAAETIKSGQFGQAFDPQDPFKPFLPRDLFSQAPTSPWICLGEDGEKIPVDLHTGNRRSRSMFLQFMRLPGGRDETLQYMERISKRPHQFPVGTQFALVEQPLLISKDGELVVSPLVVAIQLRAYLDVGRDFRRSDDKPKATQCVAEFVIQPRQLMNGNAVMRAMGTKDFHFDAGAKTATPGFSPRDPFMKGKLAGSWPSPRLNQCMDCHRRAGGRGVLTRSFRGTYDFFKVGNPEQIGLATAAEKRGYDSWKTLQKYWQGQPVELPKRTAKTEPKTSPKPELKPDRFPDTPQLRAALFNRVENEVASQLKTLHTAVLLAEAAKLSDMFELNESESDKLRLAAREAANSGVEKARSSIQKSFAWNTNYILNKKLLVDGSRNDPDLSAFRFNGRLVTVDSKAEAPGKRDRKRDPYDSIGFEFERRGIQDWLSVGFRFGRFGNTVGPKDAVVRKEAAWEKALSAVLSEKQRDQYGAHQANRLKSTVVDMMLTALQFDLDLDASQLPAVRKRIADRVQIRSSYDDIERLIERELQRLKAEALHDILSKEQLSAFPDHPQSRIKSTIVSLVLQALKFDLHLADSHLSAVRTRLEERISPSGLNRSIGSKAMRVRWSLKEKDFADVLSEPELVLWRFTQEQHN